MYRIFWFYVLFSFSMPSLAEPAVLRLSVASTAEETGLISYLASEFKSLNPDIEVELSVTGGLNTLDDAQSGSADAVLTHAPDAEEMFMQNGYGATRTMIMYNELAFFGPTSDPLELRKINRLEDFLKQLAENEVEFFVQGEKSATYQRLKYLWKLTGIDPEWMGYQHTSSSSRATLMMAAEFSGYTIADMSTYLAMKEKISDRVIPLFRDHAALRNYYSFITVDPEKVAGARKDLADRFLNFLVSARTQNMIGKYMEDSLPVTLFIPAAHLDEGLQKKQMLQESEQHQDFIRLLVVALATTLILVLAGYYLYVRSKRMETLANKHAERYELAVTGTEEGIIDWNITENTLFCSDRVFELLGMEKTVCNSFRDLISGRLDFASATEFMSGLDEYINNPQGSHFIHKFRIDTPNERWLCLRASINTNTDGTSIRISGTLTDISELHNKTMELEYQSLHDTLTNLPNRKLLNACLDHTIAESVRYGIKFALLLIDLNRFKYINDTLGHEAGDELLKVVAKILRKQLRESDTIARLGGDEFAIILPHITHQNAINVVDKIIAAFNTPLMIQGHSLLVSGAIGCVFYPEHGPNKDTLLKHADIAMYQCKGMNHPVVIYDENLDPYSERNLVLESGLLSAIDNSELELYYQPVIDIGSSNIIGAEALIRWNHPVFDLVFPDEIIPLAERTGLIKNMTRYVVRQSAQQSAAWSASGLDIRIAVNLSTWDLQDTGFSDFVENVIKEFNVSPASIEFEITESSMMIEPEMTLETLRKLKALGFGLSIDDYGTGFSSLSYLGNLPVNTLKIDKSFILSMQNSVENYTIVRSTIELAHQLGLRATAEGIEDKEILSSLNRMGCDLGQGYHIAKPMPATVFMQWFREGKWGN